jgi:hypothetical protein
MINKIILAIMVLMLAISISLSAGPQGIHDPGTGLTNPDIKEAAQGTGQGNQAQAAELAKQTETSAQKTQPGFDVIFALMGLIAVAFIVLRKRN